VNAQRTRRLLSVSVSALASLSIFEAPALAQSASDAAAPLPAQPAPVAGDDQGVADIVVTAQRRDQNAQDVPISIAAVGEGQLSTLGIQTPTDLGGFIPGLNITRANVASIPFLRGVGNFTATPGNEAAIATYVDDVYYASPAASTYSFNNLARIEVLKGPQGTLFGRNAAGGVINIVTRDPSQDTHLDADIGYGNYDRFEGNLYATTGLADGLAADIAVHYDHQADGWGRNLYNGDEVYLSNNLSLRSKWIWQLGDSWRVRLIGDYSRTRNDQSVVLALLPGTIQQQGYVHEGGFYDGNQDTPTIGRQKQYGASLRVDHEMGWANFASITAWRRATGLGNSDSDASPAPTQSAQFFPRQTQTTQEFQLAAPSGSSVQWILGLYYFHDDAQIDPIIQTGGAFSAYPNNTRLLDAAQLTDSYAGYAQATVPIFTDTNITAGLRYTRDDRSISGRFYGLDDITRSTPSGEASWSRLTYRLALDHKFTPDILGYASYSRGFKSGNFNLYNPAASPVDPEVLDAVEVGLKTDLFDRHLRFNISGFYYWFDDLQVQQSIAGSTIQTNAASATYRGIDIDMIVRPVRNLTLTGSIEILDATYKRFENATFNFPCTTSPDPRCANYVNNGGYVTASGDASGLDIPYAEPFTATLGATYVIPSSIGEFTLAGNVSYHDGFYFDVQNTLVQPDYTLVNASLTWRPNDSGFLVRVWGKNLTGAHYYAQQQVNAFAATYSAQAPLTYGVTVGYSF